MEVLMKKGIAIGIIILFIVSAISPIVIGSSIRIMDETQDNVLISSLQDGEPEFEWVGKYGLNHLFNSVVQTNDGGYINAGSAGYEGKLGFLLKTDAFGEIKWHNMYGNYENDLKMFYSIQQTTDDGFIITGNIDYYYRSSCNIWLVKTNKYGVEKWSKALCNGRGFSIQQTFDGGYIIGGDDFPYVPALLVKTDSWGNIVWRKEFGGNPGGPGASINSVVQALDGGYVATGDEYDAFVIKTDSDGNLLWNKTLRSYDFDGSGTSVKLTNDGGYIVAGFAVNGSTNCDNSFLIKIDDNGTIEWDVTVGEPDLWNYTVFDVSQTSDGGYILAGKKYGGSGPLFEHYCLLIKTDSNGNKEWELIYGKHYVYHDGFSSVLQSNDGGYVAAGSLMYLTGGGMRKAILAKVSPENQVKIKNPKNALYVYNREILPLFTPFIIGPIDIEVDVYNENITTVEFYIDGNLMETDSSEPFIWTWDTWAFFRHTIEVIGYNESNMIGNNKKTLWKFL